MRMKTLAGGALAVLAMNAESAASDGTTSTTFDEIEVIGDPWIPPEPEIRYRPAYPMSAMHRWQEGCVVLRYTIRPDGQTDDFAIMESNPVGVFEKTVVAAVFKWTFEPSDQARTLVEKFEFRNSRLATSPVKSVVSYAVPIDDSAGGAATTPMMTTAGYRAPECEKWDRDHEDGDNGPELVGDPRPLERSGRQGPARPRPPLPASRS